MEKIQIRFTESDYSLYRDYCAKYYQVHDTVRKQSIHAFLDLYEKGIIPVDTQDIRTAREILSDRCDMLKKEHSSPGLDTTVLLQLRTCSDILLFIDDIEKMFRLLRKQGADANYLMILATFSRIVQENRAWNNPELVDLPNEKVVALALPLAEMIRKRLGPDAEWHWVLREFATIAARFNQRSPELKFDHDIIQVVAPVIVGQFDKEVTSREIMAVLPSYVEESELEEFESFLNRLPEDQAAEIEIDWDSINEPLRAISVSVANQREQWYAGRAQIPGQLVPVNAGGGQFNPYNPPAIHDRYRSFDIAVGADAAKTIVYQPPADAGTPPPNAPAPSHHGVPSWVPIAIGALLVVVTILATVVFFGVLNPSGTTGPQGTPVPTLPVTTATAKPTTIATTAVPTVKPTTAATLKTYSATDIGNHLLDIAFGPDNSVISKPTKNTTVISISGSYQKADVAHIETFTGRFNNVSSTVKLGSNIERNTPADISLNLLSENSLNQINVDNAGTIVYRDSFTGTPFFIRTSIKRVGGTTDFTTYVNADLSSEERDRWLLRALLYNMGFYGESARYSDSLFYAGANNITQPSEIDWRAIQLMYGQKVRNGMSKSTVKSLI